MGICDLVPGVSGGTIAFITGIYERLINSIKAFSPSIIPLLFKKSNSEKDKLKSKLKKLDLLFIVNLGLGIATAILIGSKGVSFLLSNYYVYTLAFFVGLILASSISIYQHIENHNLLNTSICILGIVTGLSLALLSPTSVVVTPFLVFLGGFLSISALFLPGVSGSFILLVMGLYEFVIDQILHDLISNLDYFAYFLAGAFLGTMLISRAISFLFKKDKCKTLYLLLGLVLGALSVPIRNIVNSEIDFKFNESLTIFSLFIFGIGLVLLVVKLNKTNVKS